MFGQPITESIITQKAKQLPNWYTSKRQQELRTLVGQGYFGFDCICLIKGVLWGWNGSINSVNGGAVYESNSVPDVTEYGMLQLCSNISEDFNKIEIGEYLWTEGHCGIYIGDGLAVECTTRWDNCVQITAVDNIALQSGYNERVWKKHGLIPYVEYINSGLTNPVVPDENEKTIMVELLQLSKGKLRKNPQIYTVQRLLKQMGYYDMDIDGAFGEGTEKAVKTFQTKQNIEADGIVGMNTWNKLLKQKAFNPPPGWESMSKTQVVDYSQPDDYMISLTYQNGSEEITLVFHKADNY